MAWNNSTWNNSTQSMKRKVPWFCEARVESRSLHNSWTSIPMVLILMFSEFATSKPPRTPEMDEVGQ